MKKELCCKDCLYFNRFNFCSRRLDAVVKLDPDTPLCFAFEFKDNYPIEELGSLRDLLKETPDECSVACLSKESMSPREKNLEERIGELERKIQKLEKQINELDGSVKATYM